MDLKNIKTTRNEKYNQDFECEKCANIIQKNNILQTDKENGIIQEGKSNFTVVQVHKRVYSLLFINCI